MDTSACVWRACQTLSNHDHSTPKGQLQQSGPPSQAMTSWLVSMSGMGIQSLVGKVEPQRKGATCHCMETQVQEKGTLVEVAEQYSCQ